MHTAAVDSEGNLYTWGFGGSFWGGVGGLGHGDESEQPKPKLVQSLVSYGAKVGSVSCGEKHTLILTDDGEVSARRRLEEQRLGPFVWSPMMMMGLVRFVEPRQELLGCDTDGGFTCLLLGGAQVLTVGNGEYGRLGNGGSSDLLEPQPLDFFEPTYE